MHGFIVVLFTSVLIFIVGLFVDYIRIIVFKLFKIDKVSKKISIGIDNILHRLSYFM